MLKIVPNSPLAKTFYGLIMSKRHLANNLGIPNLPKNLPITALSVLQQIDLSNLHRLKIPVEVNCLAEAQNSIACGLPFSFSFVNVDLVGQEVLILESLLPDNKIEFFLPEKRLFISAPVISEKTSNSLIILQWLKKYFLLFQFLDLYNSPFVEDVKLGSISLFLTLASLSPSRRDFSIVKGILENFSDETKLCLVQRTIQKLAELNRKILKEKEKDTFGPLKIAFGIDEQRLLKSYYGFAFSTKEVAIHPLIYDLMKAHTDLMLCLLRHDILITITFMVHEIWPFMNLLLLKREQLFNFLQAAEN